MRINRDGQIVHLFKVKKKITLAFSVCEKPRYPVFEKKQKTKKKMNSTKLTRLFTSYERSEGECFLEGIMRRENS